jgi:hypothetical protein
MYNGIKGMAKGDLVNLIAAIPFQWWVTLSFKEFVSQDLAKERLLSWTRKIARAEKIQVAYIAVVSEEPRCHWHLLMLGQNRWGKTLNAVSMERWAKEWWRVNCGQSIGWNDGARILPVYEISGVARYLIKHLKPDKLQVSDLVPYNKRLLRKCNLNAPPAAARRQIKRVTYCIKRNGLEYKKVKNHMVSLIDGTQSIANLME